MTGSTLPIELLASVFDHLSLSDLAKVSCVCRGWKTVAFLPLYDTVYLCLAAHLEQFVKRILAEDIESQFSVAAHLKGLVLDIEYFDTHEEKMIGEADVHQLNMIIPRLIHLKHVSWNLMFIPRDLEIFQIFQTQCPKLDSFHVWVKDGTDFYRKSFNALFEFKNLTYFSLSVWEMPPDFEDDELKPVTSLLTRCPEISSIKVYLNGEFPYSPTQMVAALGDQCLYPCLRRFHAQGRADPNWTDFFENPELHPFRQFLTRHPRIEDLALGYVEESAYYQEIDPAEIAQLFPSLKYFEGPVFLFLPLVLSSLADQIEKIVIVDDDLLDDFSLGKMYGRIPPLPKLRRFGLWASNIEDEMLVNMLRTIVKAASQLEEVEIHLDIEDYEYDEVMELIKQVRGLRSITLSEWFLGLAGERGEEGLGWDAFASNLRLTCPKLQTIYRPIEKFDKENREKVWELRDYE